MKKNEENLVKGRANKGTRVRKRKEWHGVKKGK